MADSAPTPSRLLIETRETNPHDPCSSFNIMPFFAMYKPYTQTFQAFMARLCFPLSSRPLPQPPPRCPFIVS
jgi:hypothetical protein